MDLSFINLKNKKDQKIFHKILVNFEKLEHFSLKLNYILDGLDPKILENLANSLV